VRRWGEARPLGSAVRVKSRLVRYLVRFISVFQLQVHSRTHREREPESAGILAGETWHRGAAAASPTKSISAKWRALERLLRKAASWRGWTSDFGRVLETVNQDRVMFHHWALGGPVLEWKMPSGQWTMPNPHGRFMGSLHAFACALGP
jgi:hypothetical protein